jgi:hypothetical protein
VLVAEAAPFVTVREPLPEVGASEAAVVLPPAVACELISEKLNVRESATAAPSPTTKRTMVENEIQVSRTYVICHFPRSCPSQWSTGPERR